ncbi:uncharacterized protein LOC115390564 [Salarias fasciatus]|uniref:uncharacterized protein LOC115390564 n=1 Tax=Salarias fasciatus TaxID=181472 RepID=UPI001176AE91|nr:uncharacterized protein LOC115390564 [Salarias fasciatus]
MPVVGGGRSPWIFALIFSILHLWGRLSASSSSAAPPAPTLDVYMRSEGAVVLSCTVPEGQYGFVFMLYEDKDEVDFSNPETGASKVQFTVAIKESDQGRRRLFCCLYKNQEGVFSGFSPYLQLDKQIDAPPTYSSLQPPVLSVEPPSGVVSCGDTLTFSCTVPSHAPYLQSQSSRPLTFLLLRTPRPAGAASVVLQPLASQVPNPEPRPGVFTVGPVRRGEEGEYSCIYQVTRSKILVNSTASNVVKVTVTDTLPVPTLVLQKQADVWRLLCTGSPAYPGAAFSLYLTGSEHPIDTRHAQLIRHEAAFAVPVQDAAVAQYQCQYSVLLGDGWSHSGHSIPLTLRKEFPPSSSAGIDWPLILGSFSTVVLFLSSLALLAMLAHRKVKAAARRKKKRQEAQFWTEVHSKDHVVDLTLRRTSFTQECVSGSTETASRSPLWNSLSTFTSTIY